MNTSPDDMPLIYLKAGDFHFSDRPASVMTVLGSCLAVTMLHRGSGINAICHGLLPECRDRTGCAGDCGVGAKYVACAVRRMTKEFSKRGIAGREIEVKLFGGADMFNAGTGSRSRFSVGRQNIEAAMKAVEEAGLSILTMDVGGKHGRKLYFNTTTGDVMLKRLQPTVIVAREAAERGAKQQ